MSLERRWKAEAIYKIRYFLENVDDATISLKWLSEIEEQCEDHLIWYYLAAVDNENIPDKWVPSQAARDILQDYGGAEYMQKKVKEIEDTPPEKIYKAYKTIGEPR